MISYLLLVYFIHFRKLVSICVNINQILVIFCYLFFINSILEIRNGNCENEVLESVRIGISETSLC